MALDQARQELIEYVRLLWETGETVAVIANTADLPPATIYGWAKQYAWDDTLRARRAPSPYAVTAPARAPNGRRLPATVEPDPRDKRAATDLARSVRDVCQAYGWDPAEFLVRMGAQAQAEIDDLEETLAKVDLTSKQYQEYRERLISLKVQQAQHAMEVIPYVHAKLRQVEHTSPPDRPLEVIHGAMTPERAAQIYQETLRRGLE